jgi:carbon storage regulator
MLVLTRKIGESIRIDGQICVTVMEVDGRTVKIGIEAPRTVLIHREEVWLRILEENRLAASGEAASVDLGSMANLFKQGGGKPGEAKGKPPKGGGEAKAEDKPPV